MQEQQQPSCCRRKHTPRDEQAKRKLVNRLNRMIGQLGGIKKMVEEDRYCGDILMQIAAVWKALCRRWATWFCRIIWKAAWWKKFRRAILPLWMKRLNLLKS